MIMYLTIQSCQLHRAATRSAHQLGGGCVCLPACPPVMMPMLQVWVLVLVLVFVVVLADTDTDRLVSYVELDAALQSSDRQSSDRPVLGAGFDP